MFHLCNLLVLFPSVEDKNSPIFWNEAVCVWKEERIKAHLQKARTKKKSQHFGNIFSFSLAGAKFSLILMA